MAENSPKPEGTVDYVPFYRPLIEDDDVAGVAESIRSGWITTGPKTKEFEARFAETVGARHAVAVNSCTSGLRAGLVALGVECGDEVITTPYTFVATAATILECGARPVFVDVEPRTLNIDPVGVERAVGPKTRGIVPVHMAGHPCDMDPILEVARGADVPVMEDAAHAFPASYRGRCVGAIGDMTVFSFYATKNLTTGEGGMVTLEDDATAERLRKLILHGMDKDAWKRYDRSGSWFYEVTELGFKYNLSDIQSALGLTQLAKMDGMMDRRREIACRYHRALADLPAFEVPACAEDVEHAWHLYILRLNEDAIRIDRDRFIQEMAARGVGCSVHFIPVHLHPFYRDRFGFRPEDFPVAYHEFRRALTLPLFPAMTDREVDHVISACADIEKTYRR